MHTDAGRSVFVNGGWDGKEWLDSTWRLDLDASVDGRPLMPVWTVLRTEGFTPWKRSHHCLMAGPRAPQLPSAALRSRASAPGTAATSSSRAS